MLKKIISLLFLPFLFCSCSSKPHYETITFSSWGSITETKILKDLISDFEKNNPEIKINFMHIPQNYFQKIHLLFASSKEPDVIFINNLYLPVYASKLEDVSHLISRDEYFVQSLEAMTVDGKLLAIPRDISNLVFYKNKNLIDSSPKNLEEFLLTLRNFKHSKAFATSYEPNIFYSMPYIMTIDGEISENGIPNQNAIKGIEFYKSLQEKYAPAPYQSGSLTQAQMFLDGKIGLYLSGRWMYPKISDSAKFPWEVIKFPGVTPLDASGWAISKNTKHKDSAEKFILFLSSQQGSEYFTKTGLIVPARKENANLIESVFIEAIKYSKPTKVNKNYNKITDKLNKIFFN